MSGIQDAIFQATQDLKAVANNPSREARLLMVHALGASYEDIYFGKDRLLTFEEEKEFNTLLSRRLNHEPLSKITGWREFWSLPFRVTKDTLDPRPDSETLIEAVMAHFPEKTQALRILDLGTGTGCLLLSLLHEYENAWGVGVDCSEAASRIAQENAVRLGLKNRATFVVGNWGEALKSSFDIIISNPPYIGHSESLPKEVTQYDPALALYAGNDGLDSYRLLAVQLPYFATPKTKIFLEMGQGQKDSIASIFSYAHPLQVLRDLGQRDRIFVFCMPIPVN